MSSLLRIVFRSRISQKVSNLLSLSIAVVVAIALGIAGGIPLLFLSVTISVTGVSLYTRKDIEQILNHLPSFVGGSRNLFLLFGLVVSVSLLAHGQPSYAQLFDGARDAANSGIGTYIGADESTSIVEILTFAMWAFFAVGAIGALIGGAVQNITVLVGGLTLLFGTAILIGVLEFADGLLFG